MTLERGALRAATALLAGQVLLVLVARPSTVAAGIPALVAAGLAVVPALPGGLRSNRTALTAAVLPLGTAVLATSAVAWTAAGLPLTAAGVLVLLAILIAAGASALKFRPGPPTAGARHPVDLLSLAGLALAVVLAFVLGLVENDSLPPTGTDWGKYLLYADEIRRHGSLLIDNPVWLGGGLPFSEDPALPALYGSLLTLTGAPTVQLAWGGLGAVLLAVPATFAAAAVLFGPRPAVLAALAVAVLPMPFDMLAWHGAANLLGLAILPFVVLAAARTADGDPDRRWAAWLGVLLVAVVATHRLTALITFGTVGLLGLVALIRAPRATLGAAVIAAGAAVVPGALVASDLLRRNADGGGVQSYEAYLDTKVVWSIVVRDVTWPATAIAGAALVVLLVRGPRRPSTYVGVALVASLLLYAYSWVAHVPAYYIRAMYFLPLGFGLLIAAAVAAWRPKVLGAVAAAGLAAAFALAPKVVDDAARFYDSLPTPAALRGIDLLAANVRPGETVVTDRCTGFLSTWLIHRPIYAALQPSDIGPAVEVPRVKEARAVFAGGAAGLAAAARIKARWVLSDPACPVEDRTLPPYLQPRYLSERIAVYSIEPALQPSRNAK